MRHLYTFFLTTLLLIAFTASSQVTVTNPTNTTPNLAATYTSLANAITALSGITAISGPVIITLNPSNNQTTPAGGYVINFTAATTAVNRVTIEGSGNTITAFNPQVSGRLYDAIFKIIGSDYVTIQHFVMQENALNSTTAAASNNMTEWGVALLYASTTNGAQNNSILNNTISLNKTYSNTFGIYSNTNHTATVLNSLAMPTNISGANSGTKIYSNVVSNVNMGICLIGAQDINYMDLGNDVGGNSLATGNTITNWGGLIAASSYISSSGSCYGINLDNQKDENASYNTITSAAVTGPAVSIRGIFKEFNNTPTGTFTSNILSNTIFITYGFTSGVTFDGITSRGITTALPGATININSNVLLNNSISAASAPNFIGINCTSAAGVLNINSNIIRGTTSASTTSAFTGIYNTGAVTTTLNINGNKIGDASGNAITYSAANNKSLIGITVPTVGATASVSISSNNFQGFAQTVAGSGAHTYINYSHGASTATSDNINSNTFTNLIANTTGNITFINRAGSMVAGATDNCNNNSIVTAFSKSAVGGIVTLYSSSTSSAIGSNMVQTGNNFSNISLTGVTDMYGWNNGEGGTNGTTKNISTNTFQNWNCGDGDVNIIQSDFGGTNTLISGNIIQNISTTKNIEGIFYGTGSKLTHTISNNTVASLSAGLSVWGITGGTTVASSVTNITGNDIHSLTSTGVSSAVGIRIAGAITLNISKNKIYDINASNAGCVSSGIDLATATLGSTYTISNNIIGDIKASLANSALAVTGIKVTAVTGSTTYNIYYNSVYLNATSSGTNFGTAAVYLISNATATTGAATLRNNIFLNTSTANGTGVTASYRRNATNLNNYTAASNNNIFYGGIPSATNLIFYDGTNADQTVAAYKTRVSARDANSFTEFPPFLSTVGASVNFLHLDPAIATLAESGAVNIATYTDDFDGNIRQGNAGYAGTGTAPDIGADEIAGIPSEPDPPVITYTPITSPTCTSGNISITGVIITDATGVPLTGANRPRIYYRKNSGSWFSQPGTNTAGTATNSTWTFTIVVAAMGGVTGGDVVSYYIIAQDIVAFPNVASNPSAGIVSSSVNAVSTAPTSPNTYTVSYTLSGTYTVGVGGDFTTLTAAVNAYNTACALNSAVVFELIDNSYPSESFPISILYNADASAVKTLTIRPSATSVPLITGASGTPIIALNGANYVSFDGRQGGAGSVKSLGISNTSGGITVQFINDAQHNTVKFCLIKGQRVSNFSGTIVFATAGTGTGNDLNTIENNDISEAGGFSNNGIYSAGTAGKENDNISVLNNNIFNYFNPLNDSHGIYISSNTSGWTISGNRFFQTATRVYTVVGIHFGIYITSGAGYNITNNIIGFANSAGTGSTNMIGNSVDLPGFPASYTATGTGVGIRYIGIGVSDLYGAQTNIDGNTVAGFALYTSSSAATLYGYFCGVYVESGNVNVGANAGNTIGAETGINSIYAVTSGSGGAVVGIRIASLGTSIVQNNKIGSIIASGTTAAMSAAFTGISVAGLCNYTIDNNIIGNATADNIRLGFAASGGFLSNAGTLSPINVGISTLFKGILSTNSGLSLSITNNILRGWTISCPSVLTTGIESSGAMFGFGSTVNINSNSFGTAATNWLNATVDNTGFLYGVNASNTGAATNNILNNNFQGSIYGAQNGVGGGLIKLTGATSSNNVATISGNTFTNLSFRFTTGDLYVIYANYSIAASGKLLINNNQIVGSVNAIGNAQYHMIDCAMSSSAGAGKYHQQ